MKAILILLLTVLPTLLISQQTKISIELRQHLNSCSSKEKIPILVESELTLVEWIRQHEGKLRLKLGPYYSLEIPADRFYSFASNEHIKRIEFSTAPAFALNDSMRRNNNIDSLQYIPKKFPSSHTGKGVIMGIIDSGVDIDHEDFKDSSGHTRILYIWDQAAASSPQTSPLPYAYGQEWDSTAINNGTCAHMDPLGSYGHGSMVAGAAAGNGQASGTYAGVATNSDLIVVATDFNKNNWLQTVAEGVDYIFKKAALLNRECVINISAGSYAGSHDGLDIAARIIDSLIRAKSGRAVVAAAGNAGRQNFHLGYELLADTNFSWFEYSPSLFSVGGIYFKLYADTADFNRIQFSFSADKSSPKYSRRASTPFSSIHSRLYQPLLDTLTNSTGKILAVVQSYAEVNDGVYSMEVAIVDPDSSQYLYGFNVGGTGRFDLWSSLELTGTSNILSDNLPSAVDFPLMLNYKKADSLQSMVSSFTCLESVLTVGNYTNRSSYWDASSQLQTFHDTVGQISPHSSLGPNRMGYPKPELAAAGDIMISTGSLNTIQQLLNSEPSKISADSLHMRNGGTSMAAPGVAGILALYLEKCPNANYKEMINALISNTKKDSYTGQQYSPKWGYGKVDAYSSLMSSNFETGIFSKVDTACEGDSVEILSKHSHTSYSWNNGDSTQNTFAVRDGKYALMALNSSACKSVSDSIEINFLTSPPKPQIIKRNDSLYSTANGIFQWYFNGNPIAGATDSVLAAIRTGNYQLEISDSSNGCSSISDNYHLVVTFIAEEEIAAYTISPNPSSGIFNIEFANSDFISLSIHDRLGRVILSKKTIKELHNYQLDLSGNNKGLYLMVLQNDKQMFFQKLILQ